MPKSHKPEENPASKLENLIPERIQKILGEPALLPYVSNFR
jgi:hypothetical protein